MELSEQSLYYCEKFNIDPRIVKDYLALPEKEKGNYYYNPMCGSGKTIGLALALKERKDFHIVYCAANHSRLDEFEEKLELVGLSGTHIYTAKEVFGLTDFGSRVLLVTTSMILQVPSFYFNSQIGNQDSTKRILVIDEMPRIINQINFTPETICSLKYIFDNKDVDLSGFKSAPIRNLINDAFDDSSGSRGIELVDDIAINIVKNDGGDPYLDNFNVNAKFFLIKYLIDNLDFSKYDSYSRTELKQKEVRMMMMRDLFLNRFSRTIILDATADLYGDILQINPLTSGTINKNYKDYIENVYDLEDIIFQLIGHHDKNFIIENFRMIFDYLFEILPNDSSNYIVTFNGALYDGTGDSKVIWNCIEEYLHKFDYYEIPESKDYIYIEDKVNNRKFYLANYNRNRGTSIFKDCENVVLLGEFTLNSSQISKMISDNNLNAETSELLLKYSTADAVQEISRGVLRDRGSKKESIYLLGGEEWRDEILSYLDVELSTLVREDTEDLIFKLNKYIAENEYNSRKSSYIYIARLILNDTDWSPIGKVSKFEIEQGVNNEELPAQLLYRDSEITKFLRKLEIEGLEDALIY